MQEEVGKKNKELMRGSKRRGRKKNEYVGEKKKKRTKDYVRVSERGRTKNMSEWKKEEKDNKWNREKEGWPKVK